MCDRGSEGPGLPPQSEAPTVSTGSEGLPGRILGHYRLDLLLGKGGMGEVYRADDLALGRTVAVKILASEVKDHLKARLKKESEASARLEHPSIATFYEYGNADGVDYLAMEYVPGVTLSQMIRNTPPDGPKALELACILLEGLVHAHARGIVHRDVKPENIMVMGSGAPKLLDFGIAKELFLAQEADVIQETETMAAGLTAHGAIMGTPGYMSPEQLRGETVDAQTDVFALGAVLYELLAGEPAFPGDTFSERMGATLYRSLPRLEVADVPPEIDTVITRALGRTREERYPTAAAFLRDLRDLGSGEILAIMPNTLAITDPENLTGSVDNDWIGSGMAESLMADLAPLSGLDLVPRGKVLRAAKDGDPAGTGCDPQAVGHALGCRWVLAGAYQKVGSRLRLTMRLLEVATGRDLWVEKMDGATDDLFEMQDKLAKLIATSLDVVLPAPPPRRPQLSVQELYARGRKAMLRMEPSQTRFSAAQFEKAVDLDPEFAPAIAGLACIRAPLGWAVTADPEDLTEGEKLARRAIGIDPGFVESHVWLGYSLWRQGRFDEARHALRAAMDIDPDDHLAPYFMGTLQCEEGRFDSAVKSLQRAYRNDDKSIHAMNSFAYAHAELEHYSEAEWILERAMGLVRDGSAIHWGATMQIWSWCLLQQGRLQEAWDSCRELLEAMEGIDHTFRSGTRLSGLILLAEIALERQDIAAASIAASQALAMAQAQPRGPSKGHMQVNLLALKSMIDSDRDLYEAASKLESSRDGYDFSWYACNSEIQSCHQLARAARWHGDPERSEEYMARAESLGRKPRST